MFITKEQLNNIEASIMEHNKRIDSLEAYAQECSLLHQKAAEHWERQDASLKDLTMSNMRLANSVDSINTTITDIVKNDRPQSEFVKGWRTTASNNKMIFFGIVALVGLALTLAQLFKVLGG